VFKTLIKIKEKVMKRIIISIALLIQIGVFAGENKNVESLYKAKTVTRINSKDISSFVPVVLEVVIDGLTCTTLANTKEVLNSGKLIIHLKNRIYCPATAPFYVKEAEGVFYDSDKEFGAKLSSGSLLEQQGFVSFSKIIKYAVKTNN
jgi:hypothetical protein